MIFFLIGQKTAPKFWIWTSKIIPDRWSSAVCCQFKKIKNHFTFTGGGGGYPLPARAAAARLPRLSLGRRSDPGHAQRRHPVRLRGQVERHILDTSLTEFFLFFLYFLTS